MLRDKNKVKKQNAIRVDETGFGNIKVLQRADFGYGVDSVLLAAFAAGETGAKPLRRDAKVADLGSGGGVISFIISHKVPSASIVGIEKRRDAFERACKACSMNQLEDRVSFLNEDIMNLEGRHDFDAVVSNPPYFRRTASVSTGGSVRLETDDRYVARHETTADIGDFVRIASSMLMRDGSFYLVHRPDRLVDIITAMRSEGIEPKTMQMVIPSPGRPANIVLIHGIKGAGPELKMLPELAVHTTDGRYTETILRIYEKTKKQKK